MAVVDAAMREMYVTGRMHNRARMLVASYLTKHLMSHWKIGLDWFEDCLVDWDPASNAMGWQWSAGSGPGCDALFPGLQPRDAGREVRQGTGATAANGWRNCQRPARDRAQLFRGDPAQLGHGCPMTATRAPVVDAATGRKRALEAYENRGF
jgi:deoxyribodipyrimidine photo-lyase